MDLDDSISVIGKYSFTEILLLIVATVIITATFIVFFQKIYEIMEKWRKKKNGFENKENALENRVKQLEQTDIKLNEKLDSISSGVYQVATSLETLSIDTKKKLDQMETDNKRRSVISNRNLLYNLHEDFMKRGEITLAEREMFDSLSAEFLNCGGNSIFKSKIIPEVEALPIKN